MSMPGIQGRGRRGMIRCDLQLILGTLRRICADPNYSLKSAGRLTTMQYNVPVVGRIVMESGQAFVGIAEGDNVSGMTDATQFFTAIHKQFGV